MYNYHALSDMEFEELCKDIMEKKLKMPLRIYAKGRDGGVDLSDMHSNHKTIVQVKHYINSTFSDLRTVCRGEIKKVLSMKLESYYICVGMNLTNNNVSELYNMFDLYMASTENIITLKEIDDFLQQSENIKIVRKHFKLWLYSSDVLSEILNQDIFVDCSALLSDVAVESQYFIPTTMYEKCQNAIDKEHAIMLIGDPGVGKTMTSKMIVLYYANRGYRVRYTTNGELSDVKRSLSSERNSQEIILLDDCLGQHYFKMKDTQENELISLINYVKANPNKKLILNTRVAIFNEAKHRSNEFSFFMDEEKVNIYTINMGSVSALEKAHIFYSHLKHKKVPQPYIEQIKNARNYMKIVNHANYTPRIIEYVTAAARFAEIAPENYVAFIIDSLNNPNVIWDNEYTQRLLAIDRVLINTLYSLTDTTISGEILKECFNHRLKSLNIDTSIDQFSATLSRLNTSVINIYDRGGQLEVGVLNPSINDFLSTAIFSNALEVDKLRKSAIYDAQLYRLYKKTELRDLIKNYIESKKVLELHFVNPKAKSHFIVSQICVYKILDVEYKTLVIDFLTSGETVPLVVKSTNSIHFNFSQEGVFSKDILLEDFLIPPLFDFYEIRDYIISPNNIQEFLTWFDYQSMSKFLETLIPIYDGLKLSSAQMEIVYIALIGGIKDFISAYMDDVDVSAFCDNYDVSDIVTEHVHTVNENGFVDMDIDDAVDKIASMISEDIYNEISGILLHLPNQVQKEVHFSEKSVDFSRSDIEEIINSHIEPDCDCGDCEDRSHSSGTSSPDFEAIDFLFSRE